MKRALVVVKNRLVQETVVSALRKVGFFVEKSSSQETDRILTLLDAFAATTLLMDVTRFGDGSFEMRMDTIKEAKRLNPDVKAVLICDKVSDENNAHRIKCAKEEGGIDAFFYESVPSDYIADAVDAL